MVVASNRHPNSCPSPLAQASNRARQNTADGLVNEPERACLLLMDSPQSDWQLRSRWCEQLCTPGVSEDLVKRGIIYREFKAQIGQVAGGNVLICRRASSNLVKPGGRLNRVLLLALSPPSPFALSKRARVDRIHSLDTNCPLKQGELLQYQKRSSKLL